MLPHRGDIFWAKNVPSSDTYNNKPRPVLIISVQGGSIVALAITTKFAKPPRANEVMIYDTSEGKNQTGLKQTCAVVTTWQIDLSILDLDGARSGYLTAAKMNEILSQVPIKHTDFKSKV